MNTFSDRVKESRERLKLTQQALAEACGLKQSTISSYERHQRVNSTHLVDLAKALKVNPEWLQHGKGQRDAEPTVYRPLAPADGFQGLKDSAWEPNGAAGGPMPGHWPFPRIPPERYATLTADERRGIETMALLILDSKQSAASSTARGEAPRTAVSTGAPAKTKNSVGPKTSSAERRRRSKK